MPGDEGLKAALHPGKVPKLSPRERAVLSWLAGSLQAFGNAKSREDITQFQQRLMDTKTYRIQPRQLTHSSNDDDKAYRSEDERQSCLAQDPVLRFRDYLLEAGTLSPHQEEAKLNHFPDRREGLMTERLARESPVRDD